MYVIRSPHPSHRLALGRRVENLDRAVVDFVRAGLDRGQGAVVLATPSTWGRLSADLEAGGLDVSARLDAGHLAVLDSASLLARLAPGPLDAAALLAELRPALALVRAATGQREVLTSGDLADQLWQRGDQERALALEAAWHALLRTEPVDMLCVCGADPLDAGEDPEPLLRLCRAHGGLVATDAEDRRAILARAIDEVIGSRDATRLETLLVGADLPSTVEGRGELAVLWLRTEAPHLAQKILAIACQELATPRAGAR